MGSHSRLSLSPFLALQASPHTIAAVVVADDEYTPASDTLAQALAVVDSQRNDTIFTRACDAGIPILGFGATLPPTDLIVVSCFGRRLPAHLLAHPRVAALNLHPSHLPAFRGPAPVFWQRRAGLRTLGVTLHHMDATFDTGDIVSQVDVPLPDGSTGLDVNELLAAAGTHLLIDALDRGEFPRRPQTGVASYQGWPTRHDWHIPASWPALHAFNFMRTTESWGRLFVMPDNQFARTAIAWGSHPPAPPPGSMARVVSFGEGWVQVR